jgi:hypothetical protein
LAAVSIISVPQDRVRAESTEQRHTNIEDYVCVNADKEDPLSESIKGAEKLSEKQLALGYEIIKALRADGEYDKVEGYAFERTIKDKETGEKTVIYDLLIRAYEKTKDGYWPVWGINVDCMCRSVMEEKNFLFIHWSDVLRSYNCVGSVNNTESLKHRTAEKIEKLLSEHIGENAGACENWIEYIKQTHGPTGPD